MEDEDIDFLVESDIKIEDDVLEYEDVKDWFYI